MCCDKTINISLKGFPHIIHFLHYSLTQPAHHQFQGQPFVSRSPWQGDLDGPPSYLSVSEESCCSAFAQRQ